LVRLECGNYKITRYAAFFNPTQTPELVIPQTNMENIKIVYNRTVSDGVIQTQSTARPTHPT